MNALTRSAPAPHAAVGYGRKVLFTAVKNEAPFLLEWIAYHQVIGFDTIIMFSNDSDDGTTELLDALAAVGEIDHHYHTVEPGERPQGNAAAMANDRGLISHGDWVLWLDADEFLVIHKGERRLDDLLNAVGDADGLMISWRLFGDGGNERFNGRFISEDFTRAALPTYRRNREIKTLFRYGPGVSGLAANGIHRPKLVSEAHASQMTFLSPKAEPIDPMDRTHRDWMKGQDVSWCSRVPKHEHGHALAQINHYSVRTPEFFQLKKARGRGWEVKPSHGGNDRHTQAFYDRFNRNDVEDRGILRFQDAVTERMEALLAMPGVQQAQDAADDRVEQMIARVDAGLPPSIPADPEPEFELTLPEEAAALVTDLYGKADIVLEYGSGGSTFVAKKVGVRHVFSVESDRRWSKRIRASLAQHYAPDGVTVHYVNIGPTKAWGRPRDDSGFAHYPNYASQVWDLDTFEQPDVVLIDGRFRVACFLATMLRTLKPVDVLFDDYFNRPHYHWIEEFGAPVAQAGRMAHFKVGPTVFPPAAMTRILRAFVDPE